MTARKSSVSIRPYTTIPIRIDNKKNTIFFRLFINTTQSLTGRIPRTTLPSIRMAGLSPYRSMMAASGTAMVWSMVSLLTYAHS